jgi:hypothetical protein
MAAARPVPSTHIRVLDLEGWMGPALVARNLDDGLAMMRLSPLHHRGRLHADDFVSGSGSGGDGGGGGLRR